MFSKISPATIRNWLDGAASVTLGFWTRSVDQYQRHALELTKRCEERANSDNISMMEAIELTSKERLFGQMVYFFSQILLISSTLCLAIMTHLPTGLLVCRYVWLSP